MVPIKLKIEEWQTVLSCLADAPFKVSAPLIQQIQTQAQEFLKTTRNQGEGAPTLLGSSPEPSQG